MLGHLLDRLTDQSCQGQNTQTRDDKQQDRRHCHMQERESHREYSKYQERIEPASHRSHLLFSLYKLPLSFSAKGGAYHFSIVKRMPASVSTVIIRSLSKTARSRFSWHTMGIVPGRVMLSESEASGLTRWPTWPTPDASLSLSMTRRGHFFISCWSECL